MLFPSWSLETRDERSMILETKLRLGFVKPSLPVMQSDKVMTIANLLKTTKKKVS